MLGKLRTSRPSRTALRRGAFSSLALRFAAFHFSPFRFAAFRFGAACLLTLSLAGVACRPQSEQPVRVGMGIARAGRSSLNNTLENSQTLLRFSTATDDWGVQFEYTSGESGGVAALPEVLGGGVALSDFDLDGRLDAFFPGGGRFDREGRLWAAPSALFSRATPGRFREVGAPAEAANGRGLRQGAYAVDLDEDGFPDLLLTGWRAMTVLRNQGDGTFVDVTQAFGLSDDGWTTAVAWGDVNDDARLDLYVTRFVDWEWARHRTGEVRMEGLGPEEVEYVDALSYPAQRDRLWLSTEDGGWRDATDELGTSADGAGLSAVIADVDQDGDLDIYVAQFGAANLHYRNDGRGVWTETAVAAGVAGSRDGNPEHSAGVDFGDLDRDGYPDLWVVNGEREAPAFYRNVRKDLFHHMTHVRGLNASVLAYTGWGTTLVDLDRDEDLDIVVAGGSRWRFPQRGNRQHAGMVFENLEGERFASVGAATDPEQDSVEFLERVHSARGLASGDLDDDGDVDLVYSLLGEPVAMLENRSQNAARFLRLRLIGTQGSRTPVGARIEVATKTRDQVYVVRGGGGYLSTSDSTLLIGLARNDQVESLRVRWPGGGVQELRNVPANERLTLIEGRDGDPLLSR